MPRLGRHGSCGSHRGWLRCRQKQIPVARCEPVSWPWPGGWADSRPPLVCCQHDGTESRDGDHKSQHRCHSVGCARWSEDRRQRRGEKDGRRRDGSTTMQRHGSRRRCKDVDNATITRTEPRKAAKRPTVY